jgi:hypothetical protein
VEQKVWEGTKSRFVEALAPAFSILSIACFNLPGLLALIYQDGLRHDWEGELSHG